jgi:hypothetical protein
MLQVRNKTFETNSSSCHTVVLADGSDWKEFTKSDIKNLTKNVDYTQLKLNEYYGSDGNPCDTFLTKLAYLITYFTRQSTHYYHGWTISEMRVEHVLNGIFDDIRMYFLYDILGYDFVNYIKKDLITSLTEKLKTLDSDDFHSGMTDYCGYIDHQSTDNIQEYYHHIKERYELDITFGEYLTQILFNDDIEIEITSDGGYNRGWEDYFSDLTFSRI